MVCTHVFDICRSFPQVLRALHEGIFETTMVVWGWPQIPGSLEATSIQKTNPQKAAATLMQSLDKVTCGFSKLWMFFGGFFPVLLFPKADTFKTNNEEVSRNICAKIYEQKLQISQARFFGNEEVPKGNAELVY